MLERVFNICSLSGICRVSELTFSRDDEDEALPLDFAEAELSNFDEK